MASTIEEGGDDQEDNECPQCRGTGSYWDFPCEACEGSGRLDI